MCIKLYVEDSAMYIIGYFRIHFSCILYVSMPHFCASFSPIGMFTFVSAVYIVNKVVYTIAITHRFLCSFSCSLSFVIELQRNCFFCF